MRKGLIFHDCEQQTDAWFKVKRGKISGSTAAPLISDPSKGSDGLSVGAWTLVESIAGQIISGECEDSFEGNYYTDRGNRLEPIAKRAYENKYFVDVNEVGFIEWPNQMAGCSPDGGVAIAVNKGIEIKCLSMQKHIHWLRMLDSINPKNQKQLEKITTNNHYRQIQWCLYVTKFEEWDLVRFHPKAGKSKLSDATILPNSKMQDRFAEAHEIAKTQIQNLVNKYA